MKATVGAGLRVSGNTALQHEFHTRQEPEAKAQPMAKEEGGNRVRMAGSAECGQRKP